METCLDSGAAKNKNVNLPIKICELCCKYNVNHLFSFVIGRCNVVLALGHFLFAYFSERSIVSVAFGWIFFYNWQ